MSGNTFEIVFSGEILDGQDLDSVKARIGKLFNADEAKLARLFSGNPITIKKGMDEGTANKYLIAFKNAGAKAVVRNTAAESATSETTPQAQTTPRTQTTPQAQTFPSTKEPNPPQESGTVFEHSGADAGVIKPAPQTVVTMETEPDLSSLSLRDSSGNLVDPSAEVPEPQLDLSEFSLAPTGTDLLDEHKEVPPLEADLSGISLVEE